MQPNHKIKRKHYIFRDKQHYAYRKADQFNTLKN